MMVFKQILVFTLIAYAYLLELDIDDIKLREYYIISTKLLNTEKNNQTGCIELNITFNVKHFHLCLIIQRDNVDLFSPKSEIVSIHNNRVKLINKIEEFELQFVNGYVFEYKSDSNVNGFVANSTFYGLFSIENMFYYLENINNFPDIAKKNKLNGQDDKVIIYQSESNKQMDLQVPNERHGKTLFTATSYICSLVVVIDNTFYVQIANSNSKLAASIVINSIERTDSIFRSTDFNSDNRPDNVGFKIKQLIIVESLYQQSRYGLQYSKRPIDSRNFIEFASYIPEFTTACLGVVFTAQTFLDNVIGLSYTAVETLHWFHSGGICQGNPIKNKNLVVVTYRHSSALRLPQAICDISLAHEFGHSFGSSHDDNSKECKGFIMAPKTMHTLSVAHTAFLFSPCSRWQISRLLNRRKRCLLEEYGSFCGNGIVEKHEQCDCGSYFNCVYNDTCCLPFNDKRACKVNTRMGFHCHPSQGLCCTAQCQVRNISRLGLSCNHFTRNCEKASEISSCGVDGTCLNQQCNSNECTRIGLKECICLLREEHENYCETCCRWQGNCMSSLRATELMALVGMVNIKRLGSHKTIKAPYDIEQNICYSNSTHGVNCTKAIFKRFKRGDFCVRYGQLGRCNDKFKCFVRMESFEKLPMMDTSSSGINLLFLSLIKLIFICIIINL